MKSKPLLSDIDLSRTSFEPGDRILVRTSVNLSPPQYKKLIKTINKFTGEDVRSLIVNCLEVKIVVLRLIEDPILLVGPHHHQEQPIKRGVMNLRCSKIDFQSGDLLIVTVPCIHSDLHKKQIHDWIQEWSGKEVGIRIEENEFCPKNII